MSDSTIDVQNARRAALLASPHSRKRDITLRKMLEYATGLLIVPDNLSAQLVYEKMFGLVPGKKIFLATELEQIPYPELDYCISTPRTTPKDRRFDFFAIDSLEFATRLQDGHRITNLLLHNSGLKENILLGTEELSPLLTSLFPGIDIVLCKNRSNLRYSGRIKLTDLPYRTAIITSTPAEAYAISALLQRRQRSVALLTCELPAEIYKEQIHLYESCRANYLITVGRPEIPETCQIDHVAFAGSPLQNALTRQDYVDIAGYAAQGPKDGIIFVTARAHPLDSDLVSLIEGTSAAPTPNFSWRNPAPDISDLDNLLESLKISPNHTALTTATKSTDTWVLDQLLRDKRVREMSCCPESIDCLWNICQIPLDAPSSGNMKHVACCIQLYFHLVTGHPLPEDWVSHRIACLNSVNGSLQDLAYRIQETRFWRFIMRQPKWVKTPAQWIEQIDESDRNLRQKLHENYTLNSSGRLSSVLLRFLSEVHESELDFKDHAVFLDGNHIGYLNGFCFTAIPELHSLPFCQTALICLAAEYKKRVISILTTCDEEIAIDQTGKLLWKGQVIGQCATGDTPCDTYALLIADERLSPDDALSVQKRLNLWVKNYLSSHIGSLMTLQKATHLGQTAQRLGQLLVQNYGILDRTSVISEIRTLSSQDRQKLRHLGIKFGAYSLFIPAMLKPAARKLTQLIRMLKIKAENPATPVPKLFDPKGAVSLPVNPDIHQDDYQAVGFRICGSRVIRIDILERLADLIRPLTSLSELPISPLEPEINSPSDKKKTPEGALGKGCFYITANMMSLTGCREQELEEILGNIGFQKAGQFLRSSKKSDMLSSEALQKSLSLPDVTIWKSQTEKKHIASGQIKSSSPEKKLLGSGKISAQKRPRAAAEQPLHLSPFSVLEKIKSKLNETKIKK